MTEPSVYIETTIVSYLASRPSRDLVVAAHQQVTMAWWEGPRTRYRCFVSALVVQEAEGGDADAAKRRMAILDGIPLLALTDDVLRLAEALVDNGPIPTKAAVDALHIAVAAVHGVDYLLTWNCRHIANASMRRVIGRICAQAGYEVPVICTPEELPDD